MGERLGNFPFNQESIKNELECFFKVIGMLKENAKSV